jgi:hypothetical protein
MEVQVVSGFLGAGKTTFLNRYLPTLAGKTVLIENEFGEVGLDGELIQEDIPVREIYAGCICCSLAIDFRQGIKEIAERFSPDQIVIEPSGVGRLSDIVKACQKAREKEGIDLTITKLIAMVDVKSFEEYREDFGDFYLDQIQHAGLILPTNLEGLEEKEKNHLLDEIHKENPKAILCREDYRTLGRKELKTLVDIVEDYEETSEGYPRPVLPADRVFSSVAIEELSELSREQFDAVVKAFKCQDAGQVLRAKGILNVAGQRIHFEYTPFSYEECPADERKHLSEKAVVIGCDLNEEKIRGLFQMK